MINNSRPRIDYTRKDFASLREDLLRLAREKLPAWTDHSANDLGVVLLELFASVADSLFYYEDRLANESYLPTAVERRSVMHLLRLIGYELRPPQASSADLVLLFDPAATGTVVIDTGSRFQTTAAATGKPVGFQYIRDPISIELNNLPTVRHRDGNFYKRFAFLPVVQVDAAISDETLGSSDGSAGQRFPLARSSLIEDSLVVDVNEGSGPKVWEKKATLLNSLSASEHYIVRRDEFDVAWVVFGDDQYGKIPRRGRNTLRASYLVGGGIKGNVPPLSISQAVTNISDLQLVFNKSAATGGADAEPISEAAERGPQLFRAMGRAVTARDYEEHAQQFGVGKARARTGGWNRIELFVAPVGGGQPTDTLKADLRAYFENKRIMTSILDVRNPSYINVFIEGTLEVQAYFFTEQVQQQVENAVSNLLAFDQVDFEKKLYLSKVYEAIEAVEGVRGVNITRFALADSAEAIPGDGTLKFGWNEIPQAGYGTGILLTVLGGRRDS